MRLGRQAEAFSFSAAKRPSLRAGPTGPGRFLSLGGGVGEGCACRGATTAVEGLAPPASAGIYIRPFRDSRFCLWKTGISH